ELGDRFFDLRHGWGFVVVGGGRVGGLAGFRQWCVGGPASSPARYDVAVDRVGGGVVQRDGVPVVVELTVALFGLQLESHATVVGDPQAAGGAREQWAGGELTRSVAAATSQVDPFQE